MNKIIISAATFAFTAGSAIAAEPIGDWLVKDGYAQIRIDNCAGKMWGVVSWEKKAGVDNENPDPTKKGRPTLGMPILLGMKPTQPNLWEGEIYNSQNGKTYDAKISLVDENTLKLQGCVLGGFFCGGENWTRVTSTQQSGHALPPAGTRSANASAKTAAKGTRGTAQSEVCARVADQSAGGAGIARK